MEKTIDTASGTIYVRTYSYPDISGCDSLLIFSGSFSFSVLYPRIRKELIAALIEADKELDAAAEARKKDEVAV